MLVSISELVKTPGERKVVLMNEALPPESGIELATPVTGKITLTNTGTLLLVSGKVRAEVVTPCSRCLENATIPVETEILEEFRLNPGAGPEGQTTVDSEFEEDVESLVTESGIDLQELARQALLVAMPLQPLCKEDCVGLCPQCGRNLNLGECGCAEALPDSPFAKLANLLDKDGKSEPKS